MHEEVRTPFAQIVEDHPLVADSLTACVRDSDAELKVVTAESLRAALRIFTHVPYFQRIVRNVLSNAIRYTEQGDRILVGCRRGGGLRLIIADTGRGMSEDQTKLAFDAFQRFDSGMSAPDGFGLGLFSIRSLAKTLGMEVSLHSRKNLGTEFSIVMHH